ncbi:unnamed protein product, partial [Adineta ricciae]
MAETPTPNTGIIPIASIQNVIDSISNLRFSGVVTSIIFVTASLPITKLCLGTLYKKQCSAQTPIPIWLVTSGFRGLFCIFVTLSILGFAVLTDRYCRKTSSSLLLFMGTLIIVISAFFNFAWSILGIYWSTSIRSTIQHTDPTQTQTYCHSTPYTFVMVVSLFQAITILIFIVICVIYIRRALPTMITYSNGQAVHQAHKHLRTQSWRIQSSKNIRGKDQQAYEIRSGRQREDLNYNPLWNSGKVISNSTVVLWAGPRLASTERVYWRICLWNTDENISAWSKVSVFEIGLRHRYDWDPAVWIENKHYMTGSLGQFVVTINGKLVSSGVLNREYFDWNKTFEYSTYDVTPVLQTGDNVLGVALGKFITMPHPMKLIAQLQLIYTNESNQTIVSDSNWLTTVTGSLLESGWYDGEEYDARKELPGWDTPSYHHSTWKMADVSSIPNPNAKCRAQEFSAIESVEDINAIAVRDQEFTMKDARSTTATVRPAEILQQDGTINQITEGTPIYDRHTFSGNGTEKYIPTFRYHGFRYVQVENLTYAPQMTDMKSYTLRVNNDVSGTFNSSIELLNRIHAIVNRAVQINMQSVFTDCPHREKDEPNWGNSVILSPLYLYQSYGERALLEEFYPNVAVFLNYLTTRTKIILFHIKVVRNKPHSTIV